MYFDQILRLNLVQVLTIILNVVSMEPWHTSTRVFIQKMLSKDTYIAWSVRVYYFIKVIERLSIVRLLIGCVLYRLAGIITTLASARNTNVIREKLLVPSRPLRIASPASGST